MIENRILRKLRSRKGASISFALLLFLICSVISIVVIVAASAASGRISRMAEIDQRYYSVSSAAELVKGMLDEKTVSIAKVTVSKAETFYNNGVASTPLPFTDAETGTTEYLVPDKAAGEVSSFLTGATLIGGSDTLAENKPSASLSNDAAYLIYRGTAISDSSPHTLSLTSSAGETLAVAIKETLSLDLDNGTATLKLVLTNKNGDDHYSLILTFTADVKNVSGTKTQESVTDTTATSYTVRTTTTLTETTTVTWHLTDVSTSDKS